MDGDFEREEPEEMVADQVLQLDRFSPQIHQQTVREEAEKEDQATERIDQEEEECEK